MRALVSFCGKVVITELSVEVFCGVEVVVARLFLLW